MANYIDCDLQTLTLPEIIAGLLATDASGNVGIRYITTAATATGLDCEDLIYASDKEALLQLLRKAVAVDTNGNLSVRLMSTTE